MEVIRGECLYRDTYCDPLSTVWAHRPQLSSSGSEPPTHMVMKAFVITLLVAAAPLRGQAAVRLLAQTRWFVPAAGLFLRLPASPTPARLAAPEIILFYGRALPRQIAIATWQENQLILLDGARRRNVDAPNHRASVTLDQRPYLEVALFWGSSWRELAHNSAALARLRPSQANQTGRYYPRHGTCAAAAKELRIAPAYAGAPILVMSNWEHR